MQGELNISWELPILKYQEKAAKVFDKFHNPFIIFKKNFLDYLGIDGYIVVNLIKAQDSTVIRLTTTTKQQGE